ncbi:MAG: EF-P lysine aminoacylase EpmA [Planctomycetaceae bacterium]
MMQSRDYLPTARIEILQARARIMQVVRNFFMARGYWEVETPILSHDIVVDAHLNPFVTSPRHDETEPDHWVYLQTSPEFGMKRLLTAGADSIYQISKVFRRGEAGRNHNPEFTMIEWYRLGTTYIEQMQFVEDLVVEVIKACRAEPASSSAASQPAAVPSPMLRTTYDEAFERATGRRVLTATVAELRQLARRHGVVPPPGLTGEDRDGWLNWLLAELVESVLARDRGVFLYDFPASQAALARVRDGDPPVAERFELYLHGVEICNGYQELTDADELRRRNIVQGEIRAREGHPPLPSESRLLAAMDAGFPECSGVALGFDRLFMLGMGCESIADVIAFPLDRA